MLYKRTSLFIALYLLVSTSLHADCSRDDIQFYIEKGFTQEQITQLCATTGEGNDAPDYTPYQQKIIIYKDGGEPEGLKDGLTKEEREAVSTIKAGGDIAKLQVTPATISYTAKTCIVSANTPDVNQRYKECVEVDFTVQRENLVVSSSGKKLLFFGSQYALLEGVIDAKPKNSWDNYPVDIRRALQRNFEWKEDGEKTAFPISSDFSVSRIVNAFRILAETYGQSEETAQVAERDTEEIKEVVREPKEEKSKRWWNPFD
jgi:hypothetical protein